MPRKQTHAPQINTSPMTDSGKANLCRHLRHAAKHFPEQLAVAVQSYPRRFGRKATTAQYAELNFGELHRRSDQLAFALNQQGLKAGMKAVLMVTPSLEFFELTFALFKAGIVPILVDPGMGVKNLQQCFIESAPDAFIGIPKAHLARKLFAWGKASIRHRVMVGDHSPAERLLAAVMACDTSYREMMRQPNLAEYPMVTKQDADMAAILFTSGSTGTPKGVVYSHQMFEAQIDALARDYQIKPGERDLATFPLFSLFGPALGMASIVPDMDASKPITANPDYLFAAIEAYQCSNMFVNPALIERLGQAGVRLDATPPRQLSSIQRVISAGAPATIASIERFSKMLNPGVEVLNSYGATESLPLSKIGSKALFETTAKTDNGGGICVGSPISGVEIDIIAIDESDIVQWQDAQRLPPNQIGEIVVKGPMVSQSYYCRESATLAAKIQDGDSIRHRMGDLGYLDDKGLLWMCGRKAHRVDVAIYSPADFDGDQCDGASGNSAGIKRYFSIPCERIINTHPKVKRSALVAIKIAEVTTPLICIELSQEVSCDETGKLYNELCHLASKHPQTNGIDRFLIHPDFPVDIRHNAKIFREKLAVWAQKYAKE